MPLVLGKLIRFRYCNDGGDALFREKGNNIPLELIGYSADIDKQEYDPKIITAVYVFTDKRQEGSSELPREFCIPESREIGYGKGIIDKQKIDGACYAGLGTDLDESLSVEHHIYQRGFTHI